jgi:hypothetical protein
VQNKKKIERKKRIGKEEEKEEEKEDVLRFL